MAENLSIEEDVTEERDSLHNFSFKKANRLLKRFEYARLFKSGTRLVGKTICIDYLFFKNLKDAKLGITVSTRYGKSHERNLFKRKVREAFRHILPCLPKNISINVIPRHKARKAKATLIHEEMEQLISSAKSQLL